MTEPEIAWLAGLFDGEGHISVRTKLSHRAYGSKLQITNTCLPLLERVIAVTGIGYITERPLEHEPRRKRTWDWHTTGINAVLILVAIRPWLIAKTAAADEVIRYGEKRLRLVKDNVHRVGNAVVRT